MDDDATDERALLLTNLVNEHISSSLPAYVNVSLAVHLYDMKFVIP